MVVEGKNLVRQKTDIETSGLSESWELKLQ